jgi:Holliday junction resolvase RusA-like endonuclease
VVYRDDAQIVRKRVSKDYGEPERVEITVQPL